MGINLITLIVKGPQALDLRRKQTAVAAAKRNWKLHEWVYAKSEAGLLGESVTAKSEAYIRKHYPQETGVIPTDGDVTRAIGSWSCGDLEIVLATTPKKTVDDLYAVWNEVLARDVNWREDPDDAAKLIVVAGSSSAGDGPDGWGYRTLMCAGRLGLYDVFGIR